MIERLLKKLELRDPLHPDERRALEGSFGRPQQVSAGTEIVAQSSSPDASTLLLEGVTGRVSTLQDGSQQVTALHIGGDFVDLHSFLLRRMDHGVVALTDCALVRMQHSRLRQLTSQYPHLGRLLWLSTLLDAAIHRQWIVGIGRRTILGNTAHLFCELFRRLQVVGLASDRDFELELNQSQLADVLGGSRASINGAVQTLRAQGLIAWKGGCLNILDWSRLADLAEFDPTYLQLEAMPV
ncbi:MAG: Crp/Fnr family transcriptional regulator [Caulobacterales bacterium]|nr:Crp/Fnr family transcriptional regulator [Caulobacterales bacterium]